MKIAPTVIRSKFQDPNNREDMILIEPPPSKSKLSKTAKNYLIKVSELGLETEGLRTIKPTPID